ncbi:BppU family phage baseplate upper protein [Bacillus mycoides]|uniref:BppU family phage baseplate upper protein n=1 Tax=Bacillus mycoides TaxID=1405 RepID=UPI002570E418|nr:BppU family phage baseplate upper protein [Bacillus mycoides]WJE66679.1 BppU family phage baseplate upper protein [Bacillus mycoides]
MKTKLILDVNKTQYAQLNSIVTGRVGDKASNTVDVYVIDNGAPYNLTGLNVFFECIKPDNTAIRDGNNVRIIDATSGHFEYTFPTETFGFPGKAKQSFFSIEKSGTTRSSTQDFTLVTLPDAITGRVPSDSYFSELEDIIKDATDIVERASGSPKGVFATLADLKATFPKGDYGIYIVSADGKWYYWNNNAWTAGGVYQSTGIANNAINYQKLNIPEVQLINRNYIEVNYKTRIIMIRKDCFISIEKYLFNISPSQLEIALPDINNDGRLHLLVYNHITGQLSCKPYSSAGDNDLSIALFYQKKVYGTNLEFINYISDNDNYNYLTDRNISVSNTNILPDTIDHTRINMYEATIISKDFIVIDTKSQQLTINPDTFSVIGNNIFNLNSTGKNMIINLPTDGKLYAFVVDITQAPYAVSFEIYNDKAKLKNKRLLFYYYGGIPLGKNANVVKLIIKTTNKVLRINDIIDKHLNNPFSRTIIKLIGDSITAGLCGTGYSATDKPIGNTGYKTNVTTAVCWANMLRNHVINEYNREFEVAVNDPHLTYISNTHKISENIDAELKWQTQFSNLTKSNGIKFTFYGNHFSIYHATIGGGGIMDIYIDDVKWGELDTYGVYSDNVEKQVTGLTLANHVVEIRETNRKNDSSTAYSVYIQGLKVPKTADVINFGISGKNSEFVYKFKNQLVETNDSIIIMQIGTNDRHTFKTPAATKGYHREIIKYIKELGIDVILMSANPVSVANDMEAVRNFKMDDVDRSISQVTKELTMDYISNYKGYMDYSVNAGVTIDSLLFDGLHPNDEGYKIMFENVAKGLGFTLLRNGVSYA